MHDDLLGMIKMTFEGMLDRWVCVDHSMLTARVPPVKKTLEQGQEELLVLLRDCRESPEMRLSGVLT